MKMFCVGGEGILPAVNTQIPQQVHQNKQAKQKAGKGHKDLLANGRGEGPQKPVH
jgi:hypothetical protein